MKTATVVPSPEVWHRDDLPLLCNWRKLFRCVEVGVERGVWARLFLDRFPQCREWWGVDEWAPYGEMSYDRESDYLMALQNLEPHNHRTKLVRAKSTDAAKHFGPSSVDFVYVDAAHDYESVLADLYAWYPKLAKGAILAGHDFDDQAVHAGVKQAVCEFAAEIDRVVYITAVPGYNQETCPSWYLYRDGMPGPGWRRC